MDIQINTCAESSNSSSIVSVPCPALNLPHRFPLVCSYTCRCSRSLSVCFCRVSARVVVALPTILLLLLCDGVALLSNKAPAAAAAAASAPAPESRRGRHDVKQEHLAVQVRVMLDLYSGEDHSAVQCLLVPCRPQSLVYGRSAPFLRAVPRLLSRRHYYFRTPFVTFAPPPAPPLHPTPCAFFACDFSFDAVSSRTWRPWTRRH